MAKAAEAPNVTAANSDIAFIPILSATERATGANKATVPLFDISSEMIMETSTHPTEGGGVNHWHQQTAGASRGSAAHFDDDGYENGNSGSVVYECGKKTNDNHCCFGGASARRGYFSGESD